MQNDKTVGTLYGIEMFRGLAAISVVIYHIARHIELNFGYFPFTRITEVGYTGVDFFFVLSGFIIAHIHRVDIGTPAALGRYARQRFTRIYPFYWFVLLMTLGLLVAGGNHALPGGLNMIKNLLLLPLAEPLVGVSWSLPYEVFFYFLFACLIINARLGFILLAAWLFANLVLVYGIADHRLQIPVIISPHTIQFFIGMLAARLVARPPMFAPRAAFGAGLALFIGSMVVELAGGLVPYGSAGRIYYALGAGLMIIGCVQYETRYGLPKPWLGRIIGRSSYSLYLTHLMVNGILYKILQSAGLWTRLPAWVLAILLITGAVVAGCLLSYWVEIPLMRMLRRQLAGVRGN